MVIRRQVLRDGVEELILQGLTAGQWAPGTRLSIDGLARDLEVSPTPVREALVALDRSGLVEYVALRGYVVAPALTAEQMTELLDARGTVESAALSKTFLRLDEFVGDLERAHKHHAEVIARIDSSCQTGFHLMREHYQADWAFHQVIFQHANNRYLTQMVESLRVHTLRMRQAVEVGPQTFDAHIALDEHSAILEKVRERNHDAALKALNVHLNGVLERSLDPTWAQRQSASELS